MTLVKICGLSDRESVIAADKADYAGFVVGSPRSHRNISLDKFEELRKELTHAIPVIVTVNSSMKFLHQLRQIKDSIIQLHGSARQFAEMIDNSALGLNMEEYTRIRYNFLHPYSFLSIDSTTNKGYGGTGETWNWSKLRPARQPLIVAGGITKENVEKAIYETGASGVDVSSSVETDNQKDPEKIREFITYVRNLK